MRYSSLSAYLHIEHTDIVKKGKQDEYIARKEIV